MTPQHRIPITLAPRTTPQRATCGRSFCSAASPREELAHGLSRQPRGAPIVAPGRSSFTFCFLPPAHGLLRQARLRWCTKTGRLPAHWPREDVHLRLPTPREDKTEHLRGEN